MFLLLGRRWLGCLSTHFGLPINSKSSFISFFYKCKVEREVLVSRPSEFMYALPVILGVKRKYSFCPLFMFPWKFKILKVGNVLGRGFLKTFFT